MSGNIAFVCFWRAAWIQFLPKTSRMEQGIQTDPLQKRPEAATLDKLHVMIIVLLLCCVVLLRHV